MKKYLIVVTAIFFALVLLVDAAIFKSVTSGPALVLTCIVSWIVAGILSFTVAFGYAGLHKSSSERSGKIGDYLKRIWLVVVIIFLFGFGMSLVGGIATCAIVTITKNMVDGYFLGGAIFPLLVFAIYLFWLYKNFTKFGFQDAQKQVFNLNFKILSLTLALICVIPMVISGNAYGMYYLQNGFFVEFRSFLGFTIDMNLIDDFAAPEIVTGVAVGVLILKVLFALAVEMVVAAFAYMRGKAIFVKQHMQKNDEYQTDETFTMRKNTNLEIGKL
ncbi:MAG: hypothetical protein FWG34_02280 [Oscillospiraceae bacterium]|nr:hypothetical protein [Oscillospiraceae bacterium]